MRSYSVNYQPRSVKGLQQQPQLVSPLARPRIYISSLQVPCASLNGICFHSPPLRVVRVAASSTPASSPEAQAPSGGERGNVSTPPPCYPPSCIP